MTSMFTARVFAPVLISSNPAGSAATNASLNMEIRNIMFMVLSSVLWEVAGVVFGI